MQTAISCCWFMRREVIERVGPLDELIFYAPEDVDYCLRAWKSGLAVVYYPAYTGCCTTPNRSRTKGRFPPPP